MAGRGAGKTHAAAKELLDLVLSAPAGSEAAILAPTLTHAEAAQKALRDIGSGIPGVEWKKAERRMILPGDRSIKVHHGEHKQKTMKGPSLVALWVDEGALLAEEAFLAATPTLRSRVAETRLVVTTTPLGKNWVWKMFDGAPDSDGAVERFRFRSTDSPYADQFTIARNREAMSKEIFAQEYLAEFVDSLLLVFPNREGIFVDTLSIPRRPDSRLWLGVDLGKQRDWTVATLMDEHAQAEVVGRWRVGSPGMTAASFWGATDARVAEIAKNTKAMVVLDVGGAGGSAGAVMAEALRRAGIPVLELKTNIVGTKAQIVEQLKADVDWKRIRVLKSEHAEQLDHEMGRFQGLQRVVQGQAVTIYEGPQLEGEHDDCVISLALANWGRARTEAPSCAPTDLGAFAKHARSASGQRRGGVGGGGYIFG